MAASQASFLLVVFGHVVSRWFLSISGLNMVLGMCGLSMGFWNMQCGHAWFTTGIYNWYLGMCGLQLVFGNVWFTLGTLECVFYNW